MKKRRHREAEWLARGHQVCDQSGNSAKLPSHFLFAKSSAILTERVTHITVILQLKPRVQGRRKEARGLFLVIPFFVCFLLVFFFFRGKRCFSYDADIIKNSVLRNKAGALRETWSTGFVSGLTASWHLGSRERLTAQGSTLCLPSTQCPQS